jgi:signal transduction histidine kinase
LRAPESVLALQMSLIVVAVPMLCLGALIEERRRAERALVERLELEEMLSRLSGDFVHVASADMSAAFDHWCERLAVFLGFAEVTLALGAAPAPFARGQVPGRRGGSSVSVPLTAGDRLFGTLTFVAAAPDHAWSDELRQRLRLIAQVFANALARKEGDDALRQSEQMKSAILESVSSGVAVLDRQGRVIAANDRWLRLAADPEASPIMCGVGASFLDACRHAVGLQVPHASEVLAGVRDVLAERRPEFTIEYGRARGRGPWFAVSVVPLNRPEGGAVVSKIDVTERKRAEMEAERSRQELAHFNRVSTMGELTASLAHELNQPLTGILINAQTARRFLDADPPAIGELREILSDIVEDDTRAAEVIRRLRDLLRKGETDQVRLDLNELICDVIRLLGSDAVIRNVMLTFEGGGEPLMVHGDRIQLQQVVVNLVLNAMEAVAESAASDRRVVVRTFKAGGRVHASVRDAGPGLRAAASELVFEPFYTTKATGMGMGLSIVRSILRMHDGAITAANNPTGGATFAFDLPAADADAAA